MPINAFGGGPGSGKTYGVVEHVILPAVAAGRFIITNIDGLNTEAIYEYVAKHFYKNKIICIGHIRNCSRDAPGQDGFFPGDDSLDKPNPCPPPTLDKVAGGDLVVIDEATRYWVMGDKVSKEAQFFFREHRHFANEIGHTCDLVVIDPDLMQLARPLRGKIELSSLTHKPKGIGLNRYVVRLYRGCKLTGKPQSVNGPYKFQPEIYSLYKSYSHANAKESAVDGRQNIFASKILWGYIVGVVIAMTLGSWFVWKFFHPAGSAVPSSPVVSSSSALPNSMQVAAVGPSHSSVAMNVPAVSEKWRVVGTMVAGGLPWVVVSDPDGRLRLESPSAFVGTGAVAVGDVDGAMVSTWSGVPAAKGLAK
jgi:zona occludens toxin